MGILFGAPERMSLKTFTELHTLPGIDSYGIVPYLPYKAMHNGRWYVCERQYSFGQPVFYASPIIIRLRVVDDVSVRA